MIALQPQSFDGHELLLDGVVFPQDGIRVLDDGELVDVSYFDADVGRTVEKHVPAPRPYLRVAGSKQPPMGVYSFEIRGQNDSRLSGMVDVVNRFDEVRMYVFHLY